MCLDIDDGKVELIPWDDVKERIFADLEDEE
jgi:hypothetical protein